MTRWRFAAATDTGLVRDANEDALSVDTTLAIVADGMGGHAAGEIASSLAVEVITRRFHEDETVEGLYAAVEAANVAVLADAVANPERFGMGTTVTAIALTEDVAGIVSPTLINVGDSRVYQLRDGALRQLSDDHSVAEEWVRMGRLTPEEAAVHPRRHQLTRVLGMDATVEIDVVSVVAQPGDRLLLCSDGLSNELSPEQLVQLASPPMPLEDAVDKLVAAAKESGGRDNISVVLVEFDDVVATTTPVKKTVSTAPPALAPPRSTRRRSSRFTWRVAIAGLVLIGVVAGFVAIMHWYAYSTYYLADDAGFIAVYQGQPNGVLWYSPRKILDTTFPSRNLRPADQRLLAATISEPSLASALSYAAYLNRAWHLTRTVPSATTTTTTSVPPTTTTTVRAVTTTTKAKG